MTSDPGNAHKNIICQLGPDTVVCHQNQGKINHSRVPLRLCQ